MKTITTILIIICCLSLAAQEPASKLKGVVPIANSNVPNANSTTRAIVVGISDYQNEQIPDLQYAHKDAEAFAEYLQSPAGGELDNSHLILLTNENATSGKLAVAFDWLLTESKSGDKAVIYFSGHGDVEGKLKSQPGFLLCWDSPPQTYMAGGTFSLYFLQEIIKTLTIELQVKTTIITDACRSGKLSGNSIGGSQLTSQNLAQQYSNEIKILSCQPNEYSVEGEQWGSGRGAFSYYLVDGLYGLADADGNMEVNLLEIGRYLEDNVTKEVAPLSQLPITVGNRTEILTDVIPELLAQVRKRNANLLSISRTNQRGIEDAIASLDTNLQKTYQSFLLAVENKIFLEPVDSCADAYFEKLINAPQLKEWHATIRRNYVAALQDDAQQVINKLLATDILEISKEYIEQIETYKDFPQLLERASNLLGNSHYMYNSIKARQFLFEGFLYFLQYRYSDVPESGKIALDKLKQSVLLEPSNPLTYFYLSECFATKIKNPDSTYHYALKAMEYNETWIRPYTFSAFRLARHFKQFEKAKELLDMAEIIDSNHYYYWNAKGAWHFYQDQYEDAAYAYKKAAKIDSVNYLAFRNLGAAYYQGGKTKEAEEAFLHAISLKPVQYISYFNLGLLYEVDQLYSKAEYMYLKAIENQPQRPRARHRLANLYLKKANYKKAEQQLLKIIEINPAEPNPTVWYNLACFAVLGNRQKQGLAFLEKAIQKGATYADIKDDEDLKPLQKLTSFKEMINKYFPNEVKQ